MENTQNTIFKKLVEVRKQVWGFKKGGFNEVQKYNYYSDDQISEIFRKAFDDVWIAFIYSSEITWTREISATAKWTRQFITDVIVKYKFVDISNWDYVEWTACGSWNDTWDKWVYKAITWAVKYIYMKTFQISTWDDPEKDEVKEWKEKQQKEPTTIEEIFPDEVKKPIFDESAFNWFKQSVANWWYKLNSNTLKEIKEKYEVWKLWEERINAFIKQK